MKKLIIAAAIVCAAASSQASSILWSLTGGDGDYGMKTENFTVYVCSSIADHFNSVSEIKGKLLGSDGNWGVMEESMGGFNASGKVNGLPSYEAGQVVMQDFYYVVVNDTETGYWTFADQAQLFTSESSHVDSDLDVSLEITTGSMTSFAAVPEPTSGLLLLLGVAGLALRRRRA